MRRPPQTSAAFESSVLGDRFVVGSTIGIGSFGRVVRAHDAILDRDVAIKLIAAPIDDPDDAARNALLAEARLASAAGPHAVAVHDVIASCGGVAIVMELIPGGSLLNIMRAGTPGERARRLAEAVVASMASVHRAGVLHLDLHPGNLLLRESETIAVGDFGLAKFGKVRGLSRGGHELSWTAPELLEYRVASPQADVYALGLILRWIGRRSGVEFGDVVRRATSQYRSERPADAADLLLALQAETTKTAPGSAR